MTWKIARRLLQTSLVANVATMALLIWRGRR